MVTYNQNNRLIIVEENGTTLGEYIYNGLGQKVIKTANDVTTVFYYDFNGNMIAESDLDGNFTKEHLYRGKGRLALVDVSSGKIYYFGNDRLGTPQIMTDSTNTVVWEGIYKPFSEADVNPNSSVVNNFRFLGQYYDQETGLHYNYHRYYDPKTGRYLTPDPIGLAGGINLFIHSRNNPINAIDPLGLFQKEAKGLFLSSVYLLANASMQIAIEGAGAVTSTVEVIVEDSGNIISSLDYLLPQSIIDDKIKNYRIQYSDWSNEMKDYFQDFIAGGNRRDTFITGTRREVSEIGTINKSLVSEQFSTLIVNFVNLINTIK
jgi:RHS repeat-associated protein